MRHASVRDVRARLARDGEIALLDVREFGQYGEGHPFLAVNAPYSRLECVIGGLVPRRTASIVVFDEGSGGTVAKRAADRLGEMGYSDVAVMEGGAAAWKASGHTLYKGVNVPSKTLGELAEETFHTPLLSVEELRARTASGEPLLLLDGRTEREHGSFTIPGSLSCPNAELGLRLPGSLDPRQTVVVHCAGRTRSIIGTETLRALGVENPVFALEDGTQAWELAGHRREVGANRPLSPEITPDMRAGARHRAATFCVQHGVCRIDEATLAQWRNDPTRHAAR